MGKKSLETTQDAGEVEVEEVGTRETVPPEPKPVVRFRFVRVHEDGRAVVLRVKGTDRGNGVFALEPNPEGSVMTYDADDLYPSSEAAIRAEADKARAKVQEALKNANDVIKLSAAIAGSIELPPHIEE